MMAAEPTLENLAVVSASLDSNDQSTTTQHGVTHVSNLNGNATPGDDIFNKRIANVEEQCNSADVSVSGGSDTEGTKNRDGDRSHARTSSAIKKPATFKAVSVNKTFLGAKSSVPQIQPKSSEKPAGGSSTPPTGSVSLSTSRPRLVAKTGPAKDFSAVVNGRSGASPDPSAVWNKNRPPEPKKFTDEELQKYGIHMASRLNEEDAQGQNKWADIDDDDEDWAPEAITWGDGTKTTITNDVQPMPESEEPLGMPPRESLSPRPLQNAMMQQPGQPLPRPNALPSGKGLVFRNATQDRPALVAKPPAPPTPVKSPWASLPPVEASAQNWSPEAAYGDRMMREHGQSRDPGHRPKEIAADDFSRSGYRSNNGYGSRELFNSQSGRYEPVQERRGSMRSEHPARQHGMLQRQQMPGEHSLDAPNAYQQNRPSQEMTFGRRRGSSNVSGGSSSMYPRGLKGQDGSMPPEMATGRRLSFAGSNDGIPPAGGPPGSMHRQQPFAGWSQRSPAATFATPHTEQVEAAHGSGQPMTDEVEYQKKLMRERVELARKRRQDEEAREEAARKERIQKKLDAMGPAPEKKLEKKDETESHPTQIQRREALDTADGTQQQDGSKRSPGTKHTTPRRLSHGQSGKTPEPWSGSGPRPERFTSWAAGPSPPQPSRNVWGSPNNDRGLGNGTFNPDLGRIPGSTDTGKGSSPVAVPTGSQAPAAARGAAAPIGSRTSRYDGNGPDLASKWVNAVADGDKQAQAVRLAEKSQQEQQLAERGLGIEHAQPAIKETWRQVQLTADGSRRPVGNVDVKHPSTNAWKPSREDGQSVPRRGDVPQSPDAGVIGSGNRSMLHQQGPTGASQKTSRFFPSKEPRVDSNMPRRSSSPTPPPPTMEGHPAYEGNSRRPNVSLPKPQPVVKLPPAAMANQVSQNAPWASRQRSSSALRAAGYDGARAADGSGNWQDRINNLLNGGKPSPPKTVSTLDISSRPTLEQHVPEHSATVSLPAAKRAIPPAAVAKPHKVAVTETKPMAEECFEEQEMGSLPKIRIPNKVSEAAWQPATPPAKYLPRKFAVESAIIDPFAMSEISGNASVARIQLPGMTTPKSVPLPQSPQASSRGGRGGTSSRASPRGRGSGPSTRGAKRDREVSVSHGDKSPSTSSRGSRGSRGTYRGRGSENWNRRTVSQTQQSPTLA